MNMSNSTFIEEERPKGFWQERYEELHEKYDRLLKTKDTKYIDAEKLKELINEKWKELADKNVKAGGGKWDAEISTYLSVLTLIDSLQQETWNPSEK